MTYEWINFDYSNPLFNEPSIPISGGGIPIYGTDDLEVLNYDWCNSVPSSDLVEIYADQYESTIRFINPNDTETHRTVNVEGVALRACHEDLGEYWKVFLKHPSTPFAHYEFRGNDANDKLEISGEISAFNSYSLESEDYFGHNYFHGGAGFDTIKVEGSRKNFSLSDGDKQYDNETGRPYYRFELEQNQRRSLGRIPGFSISLMSVEQIIFDDETIDLPGAISTPAPVADPAQPSGSDNAIGAGTIVQNITNIVNNTNNTTTTNISNSGSGNITVGNIGTVNNTTTIDNSFTIQTTNINLSLAITGDSKKSEKVEGTDGDDLIADGRGKDKLIGGDGADQFYFSGEEPFKKKTVDKVIDFNSSEGDAIVIADELVGDLTEDPTLAIADTKKDLKQLSKDGYDLLYFEPKGDLYVDGNGDSKGFGKKSEGGMIADLPNDTILTESDVLIGV